MVAQVHIQVKLSPFLDEMLCKRYIRWWEENLNSVLPRPGAHISATTRVNLTNESLDVESTNSADRVLRGN
jgi:hypothetical protein